MARRFGQDEGRHAAGFLAQALATWYIELMSRDADQASAAVHQALRDLLQQFYPLPSADREELESLRAEYRVMDDHNVSGRIPATGYTMALLDPEFAEGRDPDTDPELREAQMRYASRWLRLGAERRAIAICAGDRFDSLEAALLHASCPGHEILTYDMASLRWWTDCVHEWHQAGQLLLDANR